MQTPQNYQDILARVETFNTQVKEAKAKEAGATSIPESDPRNKGEKGVPVLDETDDTNKTKNDKSNEDTKLEDESLHPVSTGKNVPSSQDGNAKEDAFTDPTTPLSKIATVNERVAALTSRIQKFTGVQIDKAASATDAEKEGSVEKKATEKPTATKEEEEQSEKEANTEIAGDYSDEFLRKLAFIIVDTEGGLEAVEPIVMKHAGQEQAKIVMQKAASEYDQLMHLSEQIQQEEMEKLAYEQESLRAAEELLKNASEEEREQIIKTASIHDANVSKYDEDFLKYAYMAGAGDAAEMMDAEAAAPEGEEAGLPGAAQGEPSIEEIVQLLDAMVASGEIDEATAAEVVEQLVGGGGGEEMPMEDPAAMGGGEAMPMEDPAAAGGGMIAAASSKSDKKEESKKEASVDDLCAELIQKPTK